MRSGWLDLDGPFLGCRALQLGIRYIDATRARQTMSLPRGRRPGLELGEFDAQHAQLQYWKASMIRLVKRGFSAGLRSLRPPISSSRVGQE